MKIVIVNTPQLEQAFIEMPFSIYTNDSNYIRPLDKDIKGVFDPAENKLIKKSETERWLLQDNNGKYIGRIAVFINPAYKQKLEVGGMGFFECVNNQEAANYLLQAAVDWHKHRNMQAIDGPINLGERSDWWGLLISGFEEPLYKMNYNPPYYKTLIENFGFQIYYNQLCFGLNKTTNIDEKFMRLGEHYAQNPDVSIQTIKKNELDKFAADFCAIYNPAFAQHGEGKSLDVRVAQKMFASMKMAMDEHICWFVYYKNQPIAMWINLPDLNQIFKRFNGKLGWLQKLQFVYHKKFSKNNRFLGIVYGIVPEWQGKGVDAYMINECRKYITANNSYQKFEMQWIGDFNPKMVNLAKSLQATEVRRLATYRLVLDPQIEFKRMPIVGGKNL
jgi:hypothetical protein